jgi:hypothetical protein
VLDGTAIFIPITVTYNANGSKFEGDAIQDEVELRAAVNRDVDNVRYLFATIKSGKSKNNKKLVPNLEPYRVESPLFKMFVPKDSGPKRSCR